MSNKLKKLQIKIGESNVYKMWFSPLINVLFSALGNTAGIWVGYILIKSIFFGIWEDLEWPGFNKLVNDGVLLLISFSFLSSVLYQSTRRLKINLFNVLSSFILVIVAAYYARVIAIEQSSVDILNDSAIYKVSLLAFWVSLLLFYSSLVYEKYVQLYGDVRTNRNNDYDDLKDQFA